MTEHEESTLEIVATVETPSLEALEARLAAAEREISDLRASGGRQEGHGRRTQSAVAHDLLAKHAGEASELSVVDAALASLPVEQRLTIKGQLVRAGLLR